MKKVLLGFADEFITGSDAKTLDFTTNKVGGLPDWHKPELIGDPFKCAVTCRICGYPAPMVVQIYAPLEESEYHRTLYIFACVSPGCWNRSESWACVRQQSKDATSITPMQVESTGDEFCDEPTEWNTYSTADKLTLSSLAEALRNIVKPSNQKKFDEFQQSSSNKTLNARPNSIVLSEGNSSIPTSIVSKSDVKEVQVKDDEYAVMEAHDSVTPNTETWKGNVTDAMVTKNDVEEENSSLHTEVDSQKDEIVEKETDVVPGGSHIFEELQSRCEAFSPMFIYVEQENDKTEEQKEDVPEVSEVVTQESVGEVYEKAVPAHGDTMFHALMSKISNNPGQIIRYCRDNSAPLLLRKGSNATPMRCSYCQSEMVFELQILPTIISHLKPDNVSFGITYPLDFGSAFVYTCRNSCWNDEEDVRAEIVIVHSENSNRNTRRQHL